MYEYPSWFYIYVILSSLAVALIVSKMLKTLKISDGVRNPGFLYKHFIFEIPLYVFGGIYAVSFMGLNNYWLHEFTTPEGIISAIIWLQYSVIVYAVIFGFLNKSFEVKKTSGEDVRFITLFLIAIVSLCLVLIFITIKQIPVFNVFSNISLGVLRRSAADNVNPYLRLLISVVSTLGISYAALNSQDIKNKTLTRGLLLISLIGISWDGSKSALASGLIIYFFAKYWALDKKIPLFKGGVFAVLIVVIVLIFFYFTGKTEINQAIDYLVQRALIGQMSGYFAAFEVFNGDNIEYMKSWFPLSSFIWDDVPSFNKDAMLFTTGGCATCGVRNTYYLAEAYAALDIFGLILAPIWLAVVMTIYLRFYNGFFSKVISEKFAVATLFVIFTSNSLTGGFSGFASMAVGVRVTVILFAIVFIYQICLKATKR